MRILPKKDKPEPLYIGISGLDYQIIRDGLVTHEHIEYIINKYQEIVKTFKPDIMVSDTNLLAWILSRKVGLPMVQIVRYASHPETAKLIWWQNEKEGMNPPNTGLLFNPILERLGLNYIEKAEQLLRGDLYIVPSIPEIEPIPQDGKTIHVGQLSLAEIDEIVPEWLRDVNHDYPMIYMTIGGGAGPVGNKLCFDTAIQALTDKPVNAVISTSSKFCKLDVKNIPKNIKLFSWVPGRLLISRADLILFHGGYGTMMEILSCGKPSLIIPFQTEQEGNGRRMEQLGCARVVHWSKEVYQKVEVNWEYGQYTYLQQNRFDMTADELSNLITEILTNEKYRENARNIQGKVRDLGGAIQALNMCEKLH